MRLWPRRGRNGHDDGDARDEREERAERAADEGRDALAAAREALDRLVGPARPGEVRDRVRRDPFPLSGDRGRG